MGSKGTPVVVVLVLLCLMIGLGSSAQASPYYPYFSYTYNYWGHMVPAPQAYLPTRMVTGDDIGIEDLRDPRDLVVRHNYVYIADTGNDRIVVTDADWNLIHIIDGFEHDGQTDGFDGPRGVFVTEERIIYVADTENSRVVVFDENYDVVEIRPAPEPTGDGVIDEGFRYRPNKLAVDPFGRMYVISLGVYDGIMTFDLDGEFQGFMGAPRVDPSVMDFLWARIATEAQRERLSLFLPVEYSNLAMDDIGFIYTTITGGDIEEEDFIRRLNSAGVDVLRRDGFEVPMGDMVGDSDDALFQISSRFVDIAPREDGMYSVLDRERGRIFTYDGIGNLLYVFGGSGEHLGVFQNPSALEALGDSLLVMDRIRAAGRITVFEPTAYAKAIHTAIRSYESGRYEQSRESWHQVLRMNANYDLAYSGIGRALLLEDRFEEAMHHFRLAEDRAGYSQAFYYHRQDLIAEHFGTIALMVFGAIAAVLAYSWRSGQRSSGSAAPDDLQTMETAQQKRLATEVGFMRRLGASDSAVVRWIHSVIRALWYSLYIIFHPFDGFWDLKYEKRGNVPAATIIVLGIAFTWVFNRQYTGFVFNDIDLTRFNALLEFGSVIVPFALWCAVNWALTTLMDGKGTLKDIYMATAYSLTPIILLVVPATIMSNYLVEAEGALLYYLPAVIGLIWAAGLVLLSTMVVHEYDMLKTIVTIGLIGVGIALFLFIAMLFGSIIIQIWGFGYTLYREIIFSG